MNQNGNERAESSPRSVGVNNSIRFPALSFSQGLVALIPSLEVISRCTNLGFKRGYYKGLFLVDSESRKFQISSARKVRRIPFRWTFRDLLALIDGNPYWEVELTPAAPTAISLDEVKGLLFEAFRKEKYSWEAISDFEEFRDKVASSNSIGELFASFEYFKVGHGGAV